MEQAEVQQDSLQIAFVLAILGFVGVCVLLVFHRVWEAGALMIVTLIFKNTVKLD